jgi:hypothetical protein
MGAPVPSFRNFPYKATEILHLYRDLWRIVYRHPPQERRDLAFRLRNEFRSKRNLAGSKQVGAAFRRGQGLLEVYRAQLDARDIRSSGMAAKGVGAQSVDGLWDQLQMQSNHILPGLRNYSTSRPVSGGFYARQSNSTVYTRITKRRT